MAVSCPECGFELKPVFFESAEFHSCNVCGKDVSLRTFPAMYRPPELISAAELARGEEEASCFYHDSKKAVQTCSSCGRFICALCAAEFGGEVLCPGCVVATEQQIATTKNRPGKLERERTLYDSLALLMATWPALTISFSIFGAPAAVYLAIRYWKRPSSIVRRFGYRKHLALILGLAQIGFWIAFLIIGITAQRAARR
jgi:hypothetical protein